MILRRRPIRRLVAVLAALVLVASCSEQSTPAGSSASDNRALFVHDIVRGPLPWTDRDFAYDPDAVRFAVFSDLTGGERDGVFDIAVEQLNMLRPET